MSNQDKFRQQGAGSRGFGLPALARGPVLVGGILLLALVAFEMFNFDTTRYALASLLGDIRFLTVPWATILATAFCAIDFAGLVRFFMGDEQAGRSNEYWYLTGAWLLGATMNAIMTWWAVTLTLLNHDLGNEILSRAQLLEIVPIFVAALVWLTRILFIGALTVAGGYVFAGVTQRSAAQKRPSPAQRPTMQPATQPVRVMPKPQTQPHRQPAVQPPLPAIDTIPAFLEAYDDEFLEMPLVENPRPNPHLQPEQHSGSRIRRRPPMPSAPGRAPVPMGATGRKSSGGMQ